MVADMRQSLPGWMRVLLVCNDTWRPRPGCRPYNEMALGGLAGGYPQVERRCRSLTTQGVHSSISGTSGLLMSAYSGYTRL
jgi:hypothetical protein